jgi:hypothetical protein
MKPFAKLAPAPLISVFAEAAGVNPPANSAATASALNNLTTRRMYAFSFLSIPGRDEIKIRFVSNQNLML